MMQPHDPTAAAYRRSVVPQVAYRPAAGNEAVTSQADSYQAAYRPAARNQNVTSLAAYPQAAHAQAAGPQRARVAKLALGAALMLFFWLALGVPRAYAAEPRFSDVDSLMDAVDARPEPKSMEATLSMEIGTASGQSLSRTMKLWSLGDTKRIIKFQSPADIKGSGFLAIENADGSDETMIYLPALGRVRRIAGGQKGDSFFGSDFSYEDITGIDPDDYTHKLLEVRDGPVYVVEATPVAGSGSTYEKLVLEVPEATLLPQRIEYYRDGAVAKVLTVSDVQQQGDYLVAGERRMESMVNGKVSTFTVITQTDVTLDADLPADLFTERFLRQ